MKVTAPFCKAISDYMMKHATAGVRSRGRTYLFQGRVIKYEVYPDEKSIHATVVGESNYSVKISLDSSRPEIITDTRCNCPYTGEGVCKHVVATLIHFQDSAEHDLEKLPTNETAVGEARSKPKSKPKSRKTRPKRRSSCVPYTIPNFAEQFLTKHAEHSYPKNENWEIQDYRVKVITPERFEAKTFFEQNFYYRGPEIMERIIGFEVDGDNLKITCDCDQSVYKLCSHAYDLLLEMEDDGMSVLFWESDYSELVNSAEEALDEFGFDRDENWKEIFEFKTDSQGFPIALPNAKYGKLISPRRLSGDVIDAGFTVAPERELGSNSLATEYDLGFALAFSADPSWIQIQPIVARKNKNGDAMTVGFSKYDSHIHTKRTRFRPGDRQLIGYCNQMELADRYDQGSISDTETLREMTALLANHPFVFYNRSQSRYAQLRKSDLNPIKVRNYPPGIKYVLTESKGWVNINIQVGGEDKTSPLSPEQTRWLHSEFVLVGDSLHYLQNQREAQHFGIAKQLDGNSVSIKNFESFFETFLSHSLKKYEADFIDFKSISVKTKEAIPDGRELYLSELGNYVIFRPFFRLEDSSLLEVMAEKSTWDMSGKTLTGQSVAGQSVEKFISDIRDSHSAFSSRRDSEFFYLTHDELLEGRAYFELFQNLKDQDIKIFGLRELKGLKVYPYAGKVLYNVRSGQDWFEVDVEVLFGDEKITPEELRKRFVPGSRYIELGGGKRGILPEEWIAKLEKMFRHGEMQSGVLKVSNKKFNLIDELFDRLEDEDTVNFIEEKRRKLMKFDGMSTFSVPKTIKAALRHYQEDGFQWLCFLHEFGWGGILADDMGLGKTLQVITFLKHVLENDRRTNLVVVPTSLLFNWKEELNKFAPDIRAHFHYGPERSKSTEVFDDYDIVFTSYGTMTGDIALLKTYGFNYVILDESQAIKNPASKRYKAARLLQASNRIAMTGTPIENNTFDLYAQMSFLNPGFLGAAKRFKEEFAKPIDTDRDPEVAAELQKLIKPFVLRRTKEQVATELPDKTEDVIYCTMTPEQQKVYDAFRNKYRNIMLEKLDQEGLAKSRFTALQGLMKLRQICDCPSLLPGEEKYSAKSIKSDILIKHIKEKTANHKILIFSQFTRMLRLLEKRIEAEGISYEYLDGQCNTKQRQTSVHRFQEDPECRVFLISLKAGGTGLNLMAADYVYIVDPWWNPAVENQAIDRCYRIGQEKKVIAYRMICQNTVEEKITELQKKKRAIAGDIVTTDDSIMKKLGKKELLDLFKD